MTKTKKTILASDKTIHTLKQDIFNLLKSGKVITDGEARAFGLSLAETIQRKLAPRERSERGTLRMSNIGKPARQLWYEVNTPQDAEDLHPNAYMKFLLGDIIEDVVLFLAEQSGHSVTGRQKEVVVNGIVGHIDAILDGTLGDVKSASPYSFKKFEDGLKPDQDAFGYLPQIQGYLKGLENDPELIHKDEAAFVALQKVTGDIAVDVHQKTSIPIEEIIDYKREMVSLPEPPERCYEPEPMGKSGNMKLGLNCSYCSFKNKCWPELRTFLYSTGPVFLTTVVDEPRVIEVTADA